MLSAIPPEATTLCGRRSLSRAGLDPKAGEQTMCPWHLQINSFFFFFFFSQCILNSILGVYPGEVHAQSSLAGYSSWGHKESDTTTQLTHTQPLLWPGVWTCVEERGPKGLWLVLVSLACLSTRLPLGGAVCPEC